VFRVVGKQPELWDAVTGEIRVLAEFKATADGRTEVPLQFVPRGSWFVVFKKQAQGDKGTHASSRDFAGQAEAQRKKNMPELKQVAELGGAWDVQFDPKWFYPDNGTGGKVRFEQLADWTTRPEDAIKHYSGIATYHKVLDLQKSEIENLQSKIYLSLGEVKNVARVRLNGRDLGIVWCAPWRIMIPAGLLKEKGNELEIEVANLWPNRLIGDATLPADKRRTVTNVRTYDAMTSGTYGCRKCAERKKSGKPAELLPSGLLGPVRVATE
jgi:hypothetical protein